MVNTQVTLKATASSGLTVTFQSMTPSVCSVNSGAATATFLTAGTCSVKESQAGNGSYAAAPDITVSFGTSAPPVVTATATITPDTYSAARQSLIFVVRGRREW